MPNPDSPHNLGVQPLDALMTQLGLANHDLAEASTEPLTHKTVQRARKGRRLTTPMQLRVVEALNQAATLRGKAVERPWLKGDLFNY